ncbi:permease [Candidatus Contubernalis alkaliaceticus]|uniref:permease n=1 Tax=Candidatus Contubernalis alkaliaceticus TaxID=338645 RepID=UPI001F4BD64E|nr:permease [Candidatus Contubernalis alkalaceticus]UNC93109.1 permease [Candidatus Contubernalis alkalaceticus]
MSIPVDIITGFLGSGKTTLINRMIHHCLSQGERVLLIQYEVGEGTIWESSKEQAGLITENLAVGEEGPNDKDLYELLEKNKPSRIIIEYNGMLLLEPLLQQLEKKPLRKNIYIHGIVNVVNASTFESYALNLGNIFLEPLAKSGYIVFTHLAGENKKEYSRIKKQVEKLNRNAELYLVPSWEDTGDFSELDYFKSEEFGFRFTVDHLAAFFILYIPFLLSFISIWAANSGMDQGLLRQLQAFNTIFVSILVQAFPFLLAGVLISALIQIFIPESLIHRIFSQRIYLAMGAAVIAGVFFPVCDCAIIPVMRRLVQKGIPLAAAVTFLLASPIVDPVVIASTFYAFPLQPQVALWRIILGITIALAVGSVFLLFPYRKKLLLEDPGMGYCQCAYCSQYGDKESSLLNKIKGVISHAGTEFFDVGKYLIIGAAFSTFLQTNVSRETVLLFSGTNLGSLLTMMSFAFVLSICSTSDAFIAMNFANTFNLSSVLGFMVFGAMLDIKNLMMLLSGFRKAFVIRLVVIIIIISFCVLLTFSLIMGG